jgi:hypothetical protein
MKRLILAATIIALAGAQVPSANAYWGRGWGWGVGVGLGGFAVGTAVGAAYAPYYYGYGYRPYWGTGFYSAGYYYPYGYNSSYYYLSTASSDSYQPAAAQTQPAPQSVSVNNNYYGNSSTPMSSANSLFGR